MEKIFFDSLENNKEISLALIDSFYDLSTKKSDFFDLELFEIHLAKHNIDLTSDIKDFFNKFISKSKTKKEVDFFSYVLSYDSFMLI